VTEAEVAPEFLRKEAAWNQTDDAELEAELTEDDKR